MLLPVNTKSLVNNKCRVVHEADPIAPGAPIAAVAEGWRLLALYKRSGQPRYSRVSDASMRIR